MVTAMAIVTRAYMRILRVSTKSDASRFFVLAVQEASASQVRSEKRTEDRRWSLTSSRSEYMGRVSKVFYELKLAFLCFRNTATQTTKVMFAANVGSDKTLMCDHVMHL